MTDEAPQDPTPQPQQSRMPKRVQFLITCDIEKGEVEIRGPINQKMFAIRALNDAIRIVLDHNPNPPAIIDPKKNGGGIVLPS